MPDAIITSTASTFGTISGTFAADQSTITGTVTGIITGTLDGSVGVPGVGVPDGGTTGQVLQKATNTSYDTVWATPSGGAWGTITGTLSNQTDLQNALDAKQSVSGMSAYLSKAGNLAGLTDLFTARDNLNLGTLNTPVFNGVTAQGSGLNVANLGATFLTLNHTGYGQFTIQPSTGITFPDTTIQTTAFNASVLLPYAPLASPIFTGDPRGPTATLGDNDTSLATTAFVQQELLSGTANAKNLEVYVRNQTGSTIPAGSIVYINGATGNRPTITLAQANNDANSAQTIGFVKTAIANNGTGYVIIRGELENIDTSALTEGVQLYLSPTVAGSWTTTKPSAPQHLVYVGIVIRSHPTLGTILVAVQNGYELNELHDVAIGTLANNDLLAYESSTDLWKNKTFSALGLATQSWVTSQGYLPASTASFTYAALTGATFTGSVNLSSLGVTFFDATTQTTAGISPATAASTYYPLTGNPSSFLVAADIAGKADLASPALTGNVTITSNSTGAALFIEQSGTGNILTLHDQAADTTFVAIDQNGKINTIPSVTASAGFNVPHGTAPTTPVNGDVWTTTSGLFMRQNGSTKQYVDLDGTQTINGAKTFSAANQTLGNATAAGTINIGTGATVSASTRTINIGTASAAGSTNNINIGGGSGTSTTTLNGTTNGVTQTAGDSSLKLATTAFVTTADNLKANLASPALTGVPTAPTATLGTNTTQIATTAFVTSAVPAAATHTQAVQFASSTAYTKVIDASSQLIAPSVLRVWPSPSNLNGTATSGAGASAVLTITGYSLTSPSAGVAGNARAFHGNTAGDLSYALWGATNNLQINFSRRVSMAFRFSQFPSSQHSVSRVLLGKIHGTAVGDLTSRGIGVKYVPTASTFDFYLQVHNGTTLTNVISSTQYAGGVADLEVVSDGAGNAVLYLNGAQVASTTGAPTGNTANNATVFAEIESTASTTNQPSFAVARLNVNTLNF